MIPAIKDFFTDETIFIRVMRAFLAWFSVELGRGTIPYMDGTKSWWVSPVVIGLAFMFGAGDKTPPIVKDLAAKVESGDAVVIKRQ